jgi:hypothetical protein
MKQWEGKVQVRFVGEKYPNIENIPVKPTLEDYYMFIGVQDRKEDD